MFFGPELSLLLTPLLFNQIRSIFSFNLYTTAACREMIQSAVALILLFVSLRIFYNERNAPTRRQQTCWCNLLTTTVPFFLSELSNNTVDPGTISLVPLTVLLQHRERR